MEDVGTGYFQAGNWKNLKDPGMSQESDYTYAYSKDGIGTLNPTLGMGLEFLGKQDG